jgi:hypothetical protein
MTPERQGTGSPQDKFLSPLSSLLHLVV